VFVMGDDAPPWGYIEPGNDETKAPSRWGEISANCNGERQSPVDIAQLFVQYDETLGDIDALYVSEDAQLTNNGHTNLLTLNGDLADQLNIPGLLSGTYRVGQLHWHWGLIDTLGSEHTVDHRSYPGEMHVVHYNTKFGSVAEAVSSGEEDALCVVGFFLQIGHNPNSPVMRELIAGISGSEEFNGVDPVHIKHLGGILPRNLDYFTYLGSLTTPNCEQIVRWVVLRNAVFISLDDLNHLRSVKLETQYGDIPSQNNRPVQPLGERVIRKNFRHDDSFASAFSTSSAGAVAVSTAALVLSLVALLA